PQSGQLLAGSMMDYAMPRAHMMPSFTTELSETLAPGNPLGVRGGGEGGTTPALGVVVNAVVDALSDYGVTHIEMPVTAERVGRAGMGSRPATEPTAYARRGFSDVVFDAYGAMRNCPVPIIAVVHGGAHGFGCAIAAACDITIASDKAVFSVPEMAHQIMPTM